MAGPGGDEVGRVAIRVVPDSSGFRSELQRELEAIESSLKLEIPVGADTSALRAEVRAAAAAIESTDADVDIGADTGAALAETRAFAAQTEALKPDIDVGADTTSAITQARTATSAIDRMSATIKVDVDQPGLGGLGAGASRGGGIYALTEAFKGLLSAGTQLPGMLGSVTSGIGSLLSAGGSATEGMSGLGTSLLGIGKAGGAAVGGIAAVGLAIVKTLAGMVQFGAQAAGVLAIVGAVTFAVGALGAAISGLPALLMGVSLAGAAVYLGLDGIKKAAQAAGPALNDLKKAVSDVFVRELTPAFEQLAKALPQLRTGFEFVAEGAANMISELMGVFTSNEGIRDLQMVLGNTRVMIDMMTPGVKSLVQTLLSVATTTGVFRTLGELVGGLSNRFAELFARFAEGGESSLMSRAFEQLKEVMFAAVDVLNELILGATEFFTAAGPGVTSALESIRNVITKIDFRGLGESFGIFADAVGRFFESIPQSTWDTLSASVRDLALKFDELASDPNMQGFFNMLVMMIPTCINMFTDFLGSVRAFVNFAVDAWNVVKIGALGMAMAVVQSLLSVAQGINSIIQIIPGLPQSFRDASQGAVDALSGLSDDIRTEADESAAALAGGASKARSAGTEFGGAGAAGAEAGIAPMPSETNRAAQRAAEELRAKHSSLRGAGNQIGRAGAEGARSGIAPMPSQMSTTTGQARTGVASQQGGFRSAGSDLAAGVRAGIAAGASSVIGAAINLAVRAFQAAKSALGIGSPSKLFRREVGAQIVAGLVLGIEDMIRTAVATMRSFSASLAEPLEADRRFERAGQELASQLATGVRRGAPQVAREVDRVQAAISAGGASIDRPGAAAGGGQGVTVIVNGAQGQDVDQLAEAVVRKIEFGLKV